jgi:hypothetical protein
MIPSTQEKLVNKQKENNELALKETEFQALKLANGVINNQTEYDAAIDAIKDATKSKNDAAQLRDEAKKRC